MEGLQWRRRTKIRTQGRDIASLRSMYNPFQCFLQVYLHRVTVKMEAISLLKARGNETIIGLSQSRAITQ